MKIDQVLYLLSKLSKSVKLAGTEPQPKALSDLEGYRLYWFNRGRREAFLEAAVAVKWSWDND